VSSHHPISSEYSSSPLVLGVAIVGVVRTSSCKQLSRPLRYGFFYAGRVDTYYLSISAMELISLTEQSKPEISEPGPERDMKVVEGFTITASEIFP